MTVFVDQAVYPSATSGSAITGLVVAGLVSTPIWALLVVAIRYVA